MLFGETIDLFEGIQITLLGMLVVFLALVILMVVLIIMERIFYRKKQAPQTETAPVKSVEVDRVNTDTGLQTEDTHCQDIIAVITAAAASTLGVQPSELVIRNIERVSPKTPVWNMAGRLEHINSMLSSKF